MRWRLASPTLERLILPNIVCYNVNIIYRLSEAATTAALWRWVRPDAWIIPFEHFARMGAGMRDFNGDTLTKGKESWDWLRGREKYFSPSFYFPLFLIFLLWEMIEELVCSAVALVLYLNTLGADFCYDDRYSVKRFNPSDPLCNFTFPLWKCDSFLMNSPEEHKFG